MADNEVIIGISADTKEAEEKLKELQAKIKEAEAKINAGGGSSNGSPSMPNGNNSTPSGNSSTTPPASPSGIDPHNWGKTAGKLFTAEFIGKVSKSGIGIIADSFRSADGGNAKVDLAESTATGAAEGVARGAMLGGPWGALAGAVVGGAYGFYEKKMEQLKETIKSFNALEIGREGEQMSKNIGISQIAENLALDRMGRSRRIEHYKQQIGNVTSGSEGIYNLEFRRNQMIYDKKQDTSEFQRISKLLESKKSIYDLNFARLFEEKNTTPFKEYQAGELIDSYAQQGITIGNEVNMSDIQDKQLDMLTKINDNLLAWVNKVNSSTYTEISAPLTLN
ncbi:MAG: bacteriocin class II family protein [Kiritimatiellae bacterium]|nr:bacteriocin class II family protein [Kiritimatiellia bacterium]